MPPMDPHVIKLCCQGCGADLEVRDDVRFLTCNYCQSKLEVVRDASATHTRVLEKIERNTDRIADNLKVLELQNELERIDREWQVVVAQNPGLERLSANTPSGLAALPGCMFMVVGGVFAAIAGVFSFFTGGLFLPFCLPGIGILAFGIYISASSPGRVQRLKAMQQDHWTQRARLLDLIDKERLKPAP
ncbi:MAG: hypothetical protein QM755_23390 [Luteolibacter sp.]